MGRRKLAQKNTLALWAGAKSDEQLVSTVLHFKVDVKKLKACQARRTLSHDGHLTGVDPHQVSLRKRASAASESSKTSTLDSASEHGEVKPVVNPHPFFTRPKKPTTAVQHGTESGAPEGPKIEPHSFFKPRTFTKEDQTTQHDGPRISKTSLWPVPMPTRETMHVAEPLVFSHDPKPHPSSIKRKRKRHSLLCESQNDISSSCSWDEILGRRKLPNASSPCDNYRGKEPEIQDNRHEIKQYHGALRGLALKRKCPMAHADVEKGSLWCVKYAPHCAAEVLQDGKESLILRDWLKTRRLHMRDRLDFTLKKSSFGVDKYAHEYDDFIVDDGLVQPATSDIGAEFDDEHEAIQCPPGREALWKSNLVILCGPSGCGKSAAIQAAAEELHFEIFEVNPTDRRSSKDVLEKVGEASQSQMVNKQKSADGSQSKSLILFEEVDVLYRDDKEFWSAVLSLISNSKRPVVLTCNDHTVIPPQLEIPAIFLDFKVPRDQLALDYLSGMSSLEEFEMTQAGLLKLFIHSRRDLRASINLLQYTSLAHGSSMEVEGASIVQELMSQQMSVSDLYEPSVPTNKAIKALPKSMFKVYQGFVEDVSFIDAYANQQRSLALEDAEVFENDTEENQAREASRDDLVGQWMIAEPLGRFTRLHPGDRSLAAEIARVVEGTLPHRVRDAFPVWRLQSEALYRTTIHDERRTKGNDMWTTMMENLDSFAVPDNWMQDFAPHNAIDRPRLSGILAADVAPYLRTIATSEDERCATEQAALAAHTGRTTRNTIANEFGMAWRRPTKMSQDTRRDVLATGFQVGNLTYEKESI